MMYLITMSKFDTNDTYDLNLLDGYIKTFGIVENVDDYYKNKTMCSLSRGATMQYSSDFTDYMPFVLDDNVTGFTYNSHSGRLLTSHRGKVTGSVCYVTYPELLENFK